MAYRVDISEPANADIEEALGWIRRRSPGVAQSWFGDLQSAIDSLTRMPNRCPIAPETHSFLIDIRQLLFSKGTLQHRIIFGVSIDNVTDEDVVTIYRVRSPMRRPLSDLEIFGEYDDQ